MRTVLRRKRQSDAFFFFFFSFQRENLTILCLTLVTNPWILFAPTVNVIEKAVTIGTPPIPVQKEELLQLYRRFVQ